MPPKKSTSTSKKPTKRTSASSTTTNAKKSSVSSKGLTFDAYTQIINDTIEELSDIYTPQLMKLGIFGSASDAEAHFKQLRAIWIAKVEESGAAQQKPPTPYEVYLSKLQKSGDVVYHTDRAADFIHQKLNPSDYNNIANPRRKQNTTHSKIMTTFDMMQFGKPPAFLPSRKLTKKDPAQRQEQKHSKKDTFDSGLGEREAKRTKVTTTTTTDAAPLVEEEDAKVPFPLQVDGADDRTVLLSPSVDIKEEEYDEDNDDEIAEMFGADPEVAHFLVGQYRTKPKIGKHKWKMALENVILHIDGKDQLYSHIESDLQW